MNFNFELILFYAVVLCGLITLFDMLFLAKKRQAAFAKKSLQQPSEMKLPFIIDYARSFFPILLIVFLLRSFLYEPFRIPSGSLEPTLLTGDFILVNKYDYGVRLPVIHKKIFSFNEPKRGDIIVFRWPPNPSVDFIKRVIGLPGDHISYIDKTLYINGNKIPQTLLENTTNLDGSGDTLQVEKKEEDLMGIKHAIFQNPNRENDDLKDIVVPENMYFVMGDNRDDSADSRYWGFVPERNIVGKANVVWMSWNSQEHNVRWKRMGQLVH
ncbi:MAG: signal peptidase I [Gammaproteobacteria bacterium]|nr:signal peptidase I [Gammaproteobacteria bacterium]